MQTPLTMLYVCLCKGYAEAVVSIVQRHCKMLCRAQAAFALTCIERPPGPPYERQLTLVENRVQDVRGVSVGIGPKGWLPICCFGALQHAFPPSVKTDSD